MSDVAAYIVLVAIVFVAGMGGGAAFGLLIIRRLDREVDLRLQKWIDAAADRLKERGL